MAAPLLVDAFAHHAWATARLFDVLDALTDEQLRRPVAGTYGSAIDTLRHVISSDAEYLEIVKHSDWPWIDLASSSVDELRVVTERTAAGWAAFLAGEIDPDEAIHEVDPNDGYQREAPLSVYLAAALHHGAEHRTQIATILATLGLEAPTIGVWSYGAANGRIMEVYPSR